VTFERVHYYCELFLCCLLRSGMLLQRCRTTEYHKGIHEDPNSNDYAEPPPPFKNEFGWTAGSITALVVSMQTVALYVTARNHCLRSIPYHRTWRDHELAPALCNPPIKQGRVVEIKRFCLKTVFGQPRPAHKKNRIITPNTLLKPIVNLVRSMRCIKPTYRGFQNSRTRLRCGTKLKRVVLDALIIMSTFTEQSSLIKTSKQSIKVTLTPTSNSQKFGSHSFSTDQKSCY
jgi:hypothetical protein